MGCLADLTWAPVGRRGGTHACRRPATICPQPRHAAMLPLPLQVGTYLHQGDANVTVPSSEDLLAASAVEHVATLNSTLWLGCIVADASAMAGEVVGLADGVPAAEDCCRACRDMGERCNAWNWCPRAGGCRCAMGVSGGGGWAQAGAGTSFHPSPSHLDQMAATLRIEPPLLPCAPAAATR